jgi:ArsR family transcriptional regulator
MRNAATLPTPRPEIAMPSKSVLGDALVGDLSEIFRLLGDRTRLRIVLALAAGTRNVGRLCKDLGLAQPTVSHHLSLLRMGKLILNSRKGKEVYYSLNGDYLERVVDDLLDEWPGGKHEIKAGGFVLRGNRSK